MLSRQFFLTIVTLFQIVLFGIVYNVSCTFHSKIVCNNIDIRIIGKQKILTKKEVCKCIKYDDIMMKNIDQLNVKKIKTQIYKLQQVDDVIISKHFDGSLIIKIKLVEIIARYENMNDDKSKFIDNKGNIIEIAEDITLNLINVYSNSLESIRNRKFLDMIGYINKSNILMSKICKIKIDSKQVDIYDIDTNKIILGECDGYKTKLNNLKVYYATKGKILVGKCEYIDLRFLNQIVIGNET